MGYVQWTTYHYLAQYGDKYAPLSPVHPTFLYESLATFIIFLILYQIRKTLNNRVKQLLGTLSYMDGSFYHRRFAYRFTLCGNTDLRVSQILSLGLVVLGFVTLYIGSRSKAEPVIESADSAETSDFIKLEDLDNNWWGNKCKKYNL